MPCCTQTNGLGGLGQSSELVAVQESVGALKAFADQIKQLWVDIQAALGIGAGRREADVIVPYQNEIHVTILAPIGDFLARLRNGQINPSCQECTGFLYELKGVEERWTNYLYYTEWMDGRAAQQAAATLAPIFSSQKAELQQCVTNKCGGIGQIPIITNPDGSVNWPIVAAGAGLIYAFSRRK